MSIIIKTPEQIAGIRKSSQLAGNCLKMIADYVKEGVHTAYLDKIIDEYIRDHNAIPATLNYNGFPKSCCISLNDVICHGIPSEKTVLKEGDILNIDVTTILNGYFGDTSTMFTIGDVAQEVEELVIDTEEMMYLAIDEVRPGNRFGAIGHVIASYAKKKNYSVVYEFCGHGVGLEFHEEPQVEHIGRKIDGPKFKPGMTFTIEPMINLGRAKAVIDKEDGWTARTIDGKYSAQFEHTVLVTEDGVDILTDVGEYNIYK